MKTCLSCEGVTNTDAERCGHCGAWLLACDTVHYPARRGETDSGNPLLGSVVDGKYKLQAVLGRGGLGTVFHAVHTGSLMHVALKLLHPRFAERPEYRRALLPEARRAATVAHQHCARLLDVGEAEAGTAYLAMELVDGETLESIVRQGPLPPSQAVLLLEQIAEALVAIHAAGLVHCDLAPRNVMVGSRDGELRVKVLDFGIARSVTMAGERARGGEFAGFVNPVFAAPELLRNGDVDPRADLYSFGSLAWLLLSGSTPVDDTDPRLAAAAVADGRLRPWPGVPGVPRRLQRLVQRCLQHDREQRPPSAQAVRDELAIVRGSRRPAVARGAVVALAAALMVTVAGAGDTAPPFLRPWAGSALVLADAGTPAATGVQHRTSAQLAQLGFDFGGFAPHRLRVDVARTGVRLLGTTLQPEVDQATGVLTLATAQPEWRRVVDGLLESCREGPVDLSFGVPGRAALGTARVCVDDEPPQLGARLALQDGDRLVRGTRLAWQCSDRTAVTGLRAVVRFAAGERLELPLAEPTGELDLGAAIAAAAPGVQGRGAGEVVLVAADPAGNRGESAALPFADADVMAPTVVAVTGPSGESFVPVGAGTARLRVQLSAPEPGCTLVLVGADDRELARLPLPAAAAATLELAQQAPAPLASGAVRFVVVDAAGNRTEAAFVLTVRHRDLQLAVDGRAPAAVWLGRELVLASGAAEATLTTAAPFRLVDAAVELARTGDGAAPAAGPRVRLEPVAADCVRCRFEPLPPGSHRLRLELEEGTGAEARRTQHALPLTVLPPAIELRVPPARSRFLPGHLQAGVLARRGASLGDGPGWRLDPALRPYVRGSVWIGASDPVPLPLPEANAAGEPLLPDVVPVPGHNRLALELRDVLARPVRVLVGDTPARRLTVGNHELAVVADFWWHDAAPEPIGEELLVEFGQPARLRLRLSLPFAAEERAELRLGIAQGEIEATQVTPDGDGAVVAFELPFEVWSVAAQLAGRTRADFPEQVERRVDAYVASPAGRQPLVLRLRTTRSTLQPLLLAEVADLPPELAAIRLLPVLAPTGPFAEPVPRSAPPRALYRTQPPVAVRNLVDLLLQDREFSCGAARALVAGLAHHVDGIAPERLVHADDPLGRGRLQAAALLPPAAAAAPADQPLCGVDFFQAYTLCRLLGLAVARDAELFRLPLGCELELAAFAAPEWPACHGAGAAGGSVAMAAFRQRAPLLADGAVATSADSIAAGDVVPTRYGAPFVGLDFGVREWVGDLPHVPGAELLLREWIGDHGVHLARLAAFARGELPPPDLAAPLRTLGVVRGLALGELSGLVGGSGIALDARILTVVPDTVPGVLRTELYGRDGRDLLTSQRDPRLALVGFRVAGTAAGLARLRGWR
ncbi:MAG: serine/threonine protein kinase [Planctomycetes bacterium]|nr:serine/threonine protein kinase [Planctomycetota bacterium]